MIVTVHGLNFRLEIMFKNIPNDESFDPKANESGKRTESLEDVGVITSRFLDKRSWKSCIKADEQKKNTEFRIAVGSYGDEDSGEKPDEQGKTDRACFWKSERVFGNRNDSTVMNSSRWNEDSRADNAAYAHRDAIEEGERLLALVVLVNAVDFDDLIFGYDGSTFFDLN